MKKNKGVGIFSLLIGIAITLFAVFIEYPAGVKQSERCTYPVTAVVVGEDIESWGNGVDSRDYYVPIVEYEVNGQKQKTTINKERKEHWEMGVEIELLVDPEFPIIYTYPEPQGLVAADTDIPVLTFVFAAFFIIMGIFILKTGDRNENKIGRDGETIVIKS